ncbi:RNA-guided endonuclease TnpB family protein [Saccharopolyspora hattusasensis]|uniref:RNA-guided endonuclease TnpB family protein n=1 Tax=Saccharopolyspora hattusasensis TaxID=1128679 RepID=UPI003D9533D9
MRDGKWFIIATCDVAGEPRFEPVEGIGVDRGINNLATTSDAANCSGRRLNRYRRWQAKKKAEIQAKNTRSAARLLKKRAKREARHAAHMNHKIAKDVVAVAQRTERGIALEALGGIRERVTVRRDQRATQSSWPFARLGDYVAYKARRVGVLVIEVDAHYTSQHCPRCVVTPSGPTGPIGTFSLVVGVVSLDPLTSSPGSTCATAHARRGYL